VSAPAWHRRVRTPSHAELDAAWQVVRGHLRPTPVVRTERPGVSLKLETLQPTGAFKVRGALAATASLGAHERAITASAGNHGLGMAFAAAVLGRSATVVVAEDASPPKVAALRARPVELVRHGSGFDAAEARALELAGMDGQYVSGYNDVDVIAGNSTIGRELDDQVTGPVTVVCGVGGGGLCAGLALWAARRDGARVVGVEVESSRAVSTAVAAGRVVPVEVGPTLADGLAGNVDDPCVTPGILAEHRVEMAVVTEDELTAAMRWLFREHGLVVEGAGAVGVAAVLAGRVEPASGGSVVVVLTGRNIAVDAYRRVLAGDPSAGAAVREHS